jgi:hypothetical protein
MKLSIYTCMKDAIYWDLHAVESFKDPARQQCTGDWRLHLDCDAANPSSFTG